MAFFVIFYIGGKSFVYTGKSSTGVLILSFYLETLSDGVFLLPLLFP